MFQSHEFWLQYRHRSRTRLYPSRRQYASPPIPSQRPVLPARPPVLNKTRVSGTQSSEQINLNNSAEQQKPRPRFKLTPRFLRTRPALRSWLFGFLVTLPLAAFAVTHSPIAFYSVTGPSMRPTINPDCENSSDTLYDPTNVLVQRWSLNTTKEIVRRATTTDEIYTGRYKRGDIIVYWTPHDPKKIGVKRVVALPGDSVTPMKGHNGEDNPAEVIIPFNHLWVEGDANDRRKSVDSNYFGPISQSLVKGRVTALWSPWWNILTMRKVDNGKNGWPARNEGRVVEGAVHEATVHPDALARKQSLQDSQQTEAFLHYLAAKPTRFLDRWEEDSEKGAQFRSMIRQMSVTAYDTSHGHEDESTRATARQLLTELQRLVGAEALTNAVPKSQVADESKKKRWSSSNTAQQEKELLNKSGLFTNLNISGDERAREREAKTNPAGAALKKMLEQKAQIASALDKEYEELDKAKLQRSGYAE